MDPKHIIIVGANGQLGKALRQRYPSALAVDSSELNIADSKHVNDFNWSQVDIVINAAAYTNVDGAETNEGRITAWQVNAVGAANLVAAASKHDLTLVHISTDYVFDGSASVHAEEEAFSPLGVYGQSKAAGDIAVSLTPKHYLLRTSWVIGDGKNFVRTMLDLEQRGVAPTVVADQVGRLTFASELARAIDHLLATRAAYGTYNVSNGGEPASWADIARQIFKIRGSGLIVTDTTTAAYFASKARVAPRPLLSIFDLTKLQATGFTPTDWHKDLDAYLAEL